MSKGIFEQKEIGNTINVTLKQNIPLIQLKLKGKIHYFLLDSGASNSALDEKANIITNESIIGSDELVTGFGDVKKVNIYELPLFIDDVMVFQKFVVAPLEIASYIEESTGIRISGVIGIDFMYSYKAIIDFYNLSIKLTIERELNKKQNEHNKEI